MKYKTLAASILILLISDVQADHEPLPGVVTFSRMSSRVAGSATNDIYAMKLDLSELRRLSTAPIDNADSVDPHFSPTGNRIVFASHRSNNTSNFTDIYAMDAWDSDLNGQGDSCVRLTNDSLSGYDSSAPRFSPDGTKIAFQRYDDSDNSSNIVVMNADGSSLENITNNSNEEDLFPTWSPDGTKIAFSRNRNLHTVEVASPHNVEAILLTPLDVLGLHWGANDKLIISGVDADTSERRLFSVDTSSPFPTAAEITDPIVDGDSYPFVSPSGNHILFSRTVDPGAGTLLPLNSMFVAHIDGTSPQHVILGVSSDLAGSWVENIMQETPIPDVNCEYGS